MPMSKTKRLKMQAQRKGYKQGMRLVDRMNLIASERNGIKEGVASMNDKTENLTMLDKAHRAWLKWAEENNTHATNTTPETYKLMSEAFVDGYLKGFAKRLTEGA